MFNKMLSIYLSGLLFLAGFTTTAFAKNDSLWMTKKGVLGSENYEIMFPVDLYEGIEGGTQYIFAFDPQSGKHFIHYELRAHNPPKLFSADTFFNHLEELICFYSCNSKEIVMFEISSQDGNPVIDLAYVNRKLGAKKHVRYVITSKNVWWLTCTCTEEAPHHFEEILSSFRITKS